MSSAISARPWAFTLLLLTIASGAAWSAPAHQAAYLSFTADKAEYAPGETALLSWAATNVNFCQASGDWNGKMPSEGVYRTPPLDGPKSYSLKCPAPGGGVEQTLVLRVTGNSSEVPQDPEAVPEPTLSFAASDDRVPSGGSATLKWAAADADSCTASGGWTGSRPTTGSESVGPLSAGTTFSLSCSGAGGSVTQSVAVAVDALPPTVSLKSSASSIDSGASTTLSWSSTNASACTASGDWSGTRGLSGSESVAPTTSATYTLSCTGDGGSGSASVTVSVAVPAPTLSFSAGETNVSSGGSTTLKWTTSHADTCTASGGWTGAKATTGSQQVGPISASTTFTLSCSGAGGSVVRMLSVGVIADVGLTWIAPTENVDGTPLTDLAGYRIHYGESSGNYTSTAELWDPAATKHTLRLSSGSYYLVMTAVDGETNESGFSNEIVRTVP
jgi:hypothetical protein